MSLVLPVVMVQFRFTVIHLTGLALQVWTI